MSHQAVRWVLREQTLTTGLAEHVVLLVIAEHADPYGRNAWPSVDTIVREGRVSRSQAFRALKRLREVGAIVPAPTRGDHSPVTYRLPTPLGELIEAIGPYLDSDVGGCHGDTPLVAP